MFSGGGGGVYTTWIHQCFPLILEILATPIDVQGSGSQIFKAKAPLENWLLQLILCILLWKLLFSEYSHVGSVGHILGAAATENTIFKVNPLPSIWIRPLLRPSSSQLWYNAEDEKVLLSTTRSYFNHEKKYQKYIGTYYIFAFKQARTYNLFLIWIFWPVRWLYNFKPGKYVVLVYFNPDSPSYNIITENFFSQYYLFHRHWGRPLFGLRLKYFARFSCWVQTAYYNNIIELWLAWNRAILRYR